MGGLGRVVPKTGDRTPLCSKRKKPTKNKSSKPIPWRKQHIFWKSEEPDSGSLSAGHSLGDLG